MFPNNLDHRRVLDDYQARLDLADWERRTLHIDAYRPSLFARLRERLLVALANFMISAGTRIREFACNEPCESMAEPAQS